MLSFGSELVEMLFLIEVFDLIFLFDCRFVFFEDFHAVLVNLFFLLLYVF